MFAEIDNIPPKNFTGNKRRQKTSAFMEILSGEKHLPTKDTPLLAQPGKEKRVLLIDHQDSFVHTLANYVRQTGANVTTVRSEHALTYLQQQDYDLVMLSPGPGRPDDFNLSQTIEAAISRNRPIFGVCLGLQGLVEYFGGTLGVLDYPMHGKESIIEIMKSDGLFKGMGHEFIAGRYHSLYAIREHLPETLEITALSKDGVIMAIEHKKLPIYAVQFHPETILSLPNQAGIKIICNLMDEIA